MYEKFSSINKEKAVEYMSEYFGMKCFTCDNNEVLYTDSGGKGLPVALFHPKTGNIEIFPKEFALAKNG